MEYLHLLYQNFRFHEVTEWIHDWTWHELNKGLEVGILSMFDLIEYAKTILQSDIPGFEFILDIAISNVQDDIRCDLKQLMCLEDNESVVDIMDKWRFVMLLQLFYHRKEYSNVYVQIDEISADFNNPKDMEGFLYYMLATDCSIEEAWIRYLKEQGIRFHVSCSL